MATRTSPICSATTCCSRFTPHLFVDRAARLASSMANPNDRQPKLLRGCTTSTAPYPVQSPTRPSWRSGCTLPIPPLPKLATRLNQLSHTPLLWQVTRLGLSTFSRIGIAFCSPTQTAPTVPMDLLGVRSKKMTKIFSHPRRRSASPVAPPHSFFHIAASPPSRSRKFASRLRTAAIPVPRGICSATARVNVVVERPV
ncbi:hypothetical protein B0H14DRAFT_2987441 [Mycena olivaceomarginata]|nr:hypothetical protein B0H14DRAFT_2987441 [Mycena olivaceomarginata]